MSVLNEKSTAKQYKHIIWLGLLLIILLVGCSKDDGPVVAEYDGGEITEGELDRFMGARLLLAQEPNQLRESDEYKQDVLQQYVAIQLIVAEADEELKTLQQKAAQEELNLLKEQFLLGNSTEEWQAWLAQFETGEQELQSFIHLNKIVGELLDSKIVDSDIVSEYERLKDDHVFDIIEISHILVATEAAEEGEEPLRSLEEALEIVDEIKLKLAQGEQFSVLAAAYSDDEQTAESGGTLPEMSATQLVPLFGQALLELEAGEISEPIEMSYGYHIIKIESRVTESFDELDDYTMDQLRNVVVNNKFVDYIETELPTKNLQLHL